MSVDLRAAIKSVLPEPLTAFLMRVRDAIAQLRFSGQYLAGLAFDVFIKEYRTEGLRFTVPVDLTRRTHRARFYYDTHERDERELVRRHVPAHATVLELGACLGIVSCVINRLLADSRKQVVVEANPQLIPVLTRNREMNGCKFAIENCLLKRSGSGEFFIHNCFVMSSADDPRGRPVSVPLATVESLEQKHGLQFDTVFMDIQGGEYEFMQENAGLLARCQLLIYETHPHIIGAQKCEQCREMLAAAGMCLTDRIGLVETWTRKAPQA